MRRKTKHLLLISALAFPLFAGLGRADSLVTTDGDMMVGPITKSGNSYTIETADGPVTLPAEKVKRVLYDHPPAAGAPSAPAAPGTAESASIPKKTIDPRTLSALIEQGKNALNTGQYGDARDAFKDALSIDQKNATAARGLGYSYIALAKPIKALDPLEIAARTAPLDRNLVLTLASALVADHNAMRAVKYLKTYLEAHSSPVDETMLNALGISLSQVDSSAAKSETFQDAVKLYLKLNTALEATVDGKKRWGTEWLDAKDVASRQDARQQVQNQVDAAAVKLQKATTELANAQQQLNQLATGLGQRPNGKIRNAQDKVNQATEAQTKAQTEYDTISKQLATVPLPIFPTEIVVDESQLTMDPPAPATTVTSTDDTKIASAASVKPDPTDPAPAPPVTKKPKKPKPVDQTAQAPADTDPPPVTTPKPAAAKHVTRYSVAFAIAPDVLVTAASAVEDATDISIETADGKSLTAKVLRAHHSDGLALLKVDGANFPVLSLATEPGIGGLTCFGYPDVDLFNPKAHSINASAGSQVGEWTIHMDLPPRLPGGPLLQNGKVVGVELGDRDTDQAAVPAANLKTLLSLVEDTANPATLTTDPKQAVVQVTAER